jgi:hypothetical protein
MYWLTASHAVMYRSLLIADSGTGDVSPLRVQAPATVSSLVPTAVAIIACWNERCPTDIIVLNHVALAMVGCSRSGMLLRK